MQEVKELSCLWFYGENLVPKIEDAAEDQILPQNPVPEKFFPTSAEEFHSVELRLSSSGSPEYFHTTQKNFPSEVVCRRNVVDLKFNV